MERVKPEDKKNKKKQGNFLVMPPNLPLAYRVMDVSKEFIQSLLPAMEDEVRSRARRAAIIGFTIGFLIGLTPFLYIILSK